MCELGALDTGQSGTIVKNSAPDPLKSRLIAMGFIRGNQVEILARSLTGATVMVRLNRAERFSLRHEEARHLLLKTD